MFLLQTPVSHTTSSVFIFTPEEELLEGPALPQQRGVAGTSCSPRTRCVCMAPLTGSGADLGSPLCAWAFHCPCAQIPAATSKGQGRARKRKEAGRGLFSAVLSFSPTTSAGSCGKRDILLTDQPSWGKQLSILQNANGENHPSCTCLQGQSALFVPWMLSTRFIKVMLLLRGAMERSQSLFFLSDLITGIFILEIRKKKNLVHIRSYNQCCLEQLLLSFIFSRKYLHFSHQYCVLMGRMKYAAPQEQKSSSLQMVFGKAVGWDHWT